MPAQRTMSAPAIYAQAAVHRRPQRKEAESIIRHLIESPGAALEDDDLIRLYAYLSPPPPKRPRTAWDWVAQATARKQTQPEIFQFIQVAPDSCGTLRATATDGKTLHSLELNDDRKPGIYDTQGNLTDRSLDEYPLWESMVCFLSPSRAAVLPKSSSIPVALSECLLGRMFSYDDDVRVFYVLPPGPGHTRGPWLDAELVRRAHQSDEPVSVDIQGPTEAVCLRLPDRLALIMPINQPDNLEGAINAGYIQFDRRPEDLL